MDVGGINLPSIVYTSVDSQEGENFQSDDSADVAQSDDSVEAVQSDDSADIVHSDAAFMGAHDPHYIAPSLCHAADDESCQFLLDATSDNGSCALSPAVGPSFALHHHPLASFSPQIAATIANEAGTRSPTPSESSSQSSGSQEAVGLLSLHQYQPLCGTPQPAQQMNNIEYTTLAPDHIISKMKCASLDPLNAKLVPGKQDLVTAHDLNPKACEGDRCMVGDINIDARYRDAFYVNWNWPKIRHFCALTYLGVLLSLFVVGVALLVKMPQGHDCDPVREWWQGGVSYHIFVPSFKDSDHDGIGDLQGVVSKLDYIESLGVTMVRLAPMFERAESHYDTVLQQQDPAPTVAPTGPGVAWNLTRVDYSVGSSSEVQLLAALLHVRGMRLLLDLPLAPGLDTQHLAVPGVSATWPPLDHLSASAALAEVRRALPHWLRLGVDGFVFPDLHTLVTEHSVLQVVDAVEEWRQVLDASPRRGQERILVLNTELIRALPDGAAPRARHPPQQEHSYLDDLATLDDTWTADGESNETVAEGLAGRVCAAAHLLEQRLLLTAPDDVVHQMRDALQLSLPPGAPWLLWSTGGVGRPRDSAPKDPSDGVPPGAAGTQPTDVARNNVGQNLLLMFLPGSASLYYGNEIDVGVPPEMKWLEWAGVMAWSGGQHGGFSTQDPWLGLGPLHASRNAAFRRHSSVAAVANLARHKAVEPPLFIKSLLGFEGDYHPTHSSNLKVRYVDDDMLILERFYPRRRQYTVVANLGTQVVTRDLSHYYYGGHVVASSHNNSGYIEFRRLQLQPSEVLVCVLDK